MIVGLFVNLFCKFVPSVMTTKNLLPVSISLFLLFLSGCAVTQPQNTPAREQHLRSSITSRGYWLYVPSNYNHNRPAPLIVTCHGTPPYDVANHHIREWKMLAENNYCIVVAPDLIGTDGLLGDGPVIGMLANEQIILSILSELGYKYNIDMANIMITGFSGGGFPTYWVGLRNPDTFSVVVARNCNFNESNLRDWYTPMAKDTKVMIYWGQNDPLTIKSQSKRGLRFLKSRGFKFVHNHEIPGAGHERKPEVAMDFFLKNLATPRPSLK